MQRDHQRLDFILEQIHEGSIVADIGTDHAHLIIKAIQQKKAFYAFGCDINEKPLKSAQNNVKKANLEDKIDLVLSNGLDFFWRNTIHLDCVVIAGLGSKTISEILDQDYEQISHYLLCSNTEPSLIREKLAMNNLYITNEFFLLDQKRKYWLIKTSRTEGYLVKNYKNAFLGVDPQLFKDQDYQAYLSEVYLRNKEILKLTKDKLKRKEIKQQQKLLRKVI